MRHIIHAFAVVVSFALLPQLALAATAGIGKITALQGTGTLLRGDQGLPMFKGMSVVALDTLKTEGDGIATITFDDQSTVTVGKDSELTIDAFVYDPNAKEGNQSALGVSKGFFHFVSGKLARDKVKLKTPVSTIGIRGTELAGQVEESGKTLVSLVECCVDLSNEHGVISLDRIGTYSEVGSHSSAPTSPSFTPDWWADQAVAALGTTHEALGLPKLSQPAYDEPAERTPSVGAGSSETRGSSESGPKNRKSFPFFKDSLIK